MKCSTKNYSVATINFKKQKDLYELAPVGYITLDKKGTILQCNLAATELFGLTKELLYNNPINEFILPDDQDIFYHFRRELMIWSEKKSCELRFIRGEEVFWGRLDSSPVLNHGSDSSTWHIILSDITATKKLHENLTATNEICEREDKENLDLMSTTSLKIRTALNTILGLTEVVLETTQLPGLQTEYLMQSNKVAKQLLTQLEEIESNFQ